MKPILASLAGLTLAATMVAGSAHALYEQARWTTLDNGLDVIVIENHRAPAVHARLAFKVGALDEAAGQYGIAHVLEHMMFRGAPEYKGRGLEPGEYDAVLDRIGADHNASTSADLTSYYAWFGSEHLETFLEMQAIIMNGLDADPAQLENEKGVVQQEFRQRWENNPGARAGHELRAALRGAEPYDHPIIGFEDEYNALTSQDLLDFHATWYKPNNAVLIVAGDVYPEEVFALAEQYFGDFEAAEVPSRERPDATREFEPGFEKVTDALIQRPSARRAWRLPEIIAEDGPEAYRDRYVARILTSMLSSGLDAPFTKELVTEREIALGAGFALVFDDGQDWAQLSVDPAEGQEALFVLDEAEKFLRDWLENGLTAERLERQKRRFMNGLVYSADSIDGPASSFESLVSSGAPYDLFWSLEETIESVTIDDVKRIAAVFLNNANVAKTLELGPLEE